ncbi:MAG: YidC/Oxa1 family membrane protein insertase [Acholeplasmatales bacterium]|nr:YidC/Oxa1 family membrane protein insertase [Acholeplasmatales bacterium]
MNNFIYRNRHKLILIALCFVLLVSLTSCRFDSSSWYSKPYTTYADDWKDMWDGGKNAFNAFFAWPVNLLSYPIARMCHAIGKVCGNSYFWAIFFTTLIVRTLAWPIYSKQNSSSLKMQLMQPELTAIQRKYQGRQDPRSQQMLQQETMRLYKKYNINPLGCVFTMFLQFPIFMSMYEVVQRINASRTVSVGATEVTYKGVFALSNTKVFGVFEMDTSAFKAFSSQNWADFFFGVFVAVAFVGITLLQQKLAQRPPKYQKVRPNDKKKDQPNQMKYVMIIMNVMFAFMALSNTTLGIYWLIGACYQILQAQVGRKINEHKYYKAVKQNADVF